MNIFNASAPMPIAIIGMGMRLPADVRTEAELWDMLTNSRSGISEIPAERWPVAELQHPQRGEPGRSVSFRAGVLKDADKFDASFFGISPREAAWMDPQQRILLEMAHDAMEDAGIPPESLSGSQCGVYVGISGMDYGQNALEDLASMTAWTMTGNTLSIAANRLSWIYNLQGPSLAIDTACSSSLAAIHQACQAIRNGETPLALAGGINVLMHPYAFIGFSHAGMLSANGECRPFDAAAAGYVRGEGGALFLLKPLEQAKKDGDKIHAVILGTGINSDGSRKSGLTIPSAKAQTELMESVLEKSGLSPDDLDFVEAHGTGTPVGDPVEANSIGSAYGKKRKGALPISSAKGNFGHLEPASGMAGMLKAILSMRHGYIPPMPFDFKANPEIPFEDLNIFCAASGHRLSPHPDRPYIAAINSFGFGGLNAHVLLAAQPCNEEPADNPSTGRTPPLFLSARTDGALRELAKNYADYIENKDDIAFYDIARSSALHRSFHEKRLCVFADDLPGQVASLRDFAANRSNPNFASAEALSNGGGIAFIYSGNGSQWQGMGRQLLEESEEFSQAMLMLDRELSPLLGWSLIDGLKNDDPEFLEDTVHAQPLLFAIQAALTILLKKMGIIPQATAGHSVGEIAAAYAAGQLTLQEAMRIVHARSVAQGRTRGKGKMAAVGMGAKELLPLLREMALEKDLEIAAINSPGNCTVSGNARTLEKLGHQLTEKGIFFRLLNLEYAFHSAAMEPEAKYLEEMLAGLAPQDKPKTIFVSTVNAEKMTGSKLDSNYWWRNMRDSVNFTGAIRKLADEGIRVFLEIGPHAVLQRYMRENLAELKDGWRALPLLQRENAGLNRICQIAMTLHLLSGDNSHKNLYFSTGKKASLPLYPWQKEKHSFPKTNERKYKISRNWPLLGWSLTGASPMWENILDPRKDLWLEDHKVANTTVLPAAAWLEIILEAGRAWLKSEETGVENLSIKVPLVFEDDQARTLVTILNPEDGSCRVLSRPRLKSDNWIEHARARVLKIQDYPLEDATWQTKASRHITGEKLYERTRALGLEYGEFFQRVKNIHFDGSTFQAELTDARSQDFILDPGAIDACFHSLVTLYEKPQSNAAYLPTGIGKVILHHSRPIKRIRGKLTKISHRTIHADFLLIDDKGKAAASLSDCRFRKLPGSAQSVNISQWESLGEFSPLPRFRALDLPGNIQELLAQAESRKELANEERKLWHMELLPGLEAMTALALASLKKKGSSRLDIILPPPLVKWLAQKLMEASFPEDTSQLPDWKEIWKELQKLAPRWLTALLPLVRILDKLEDMADQEKSREEILQDLKNIPISRTSGADHIAWKGTETLLAAFVMAILQRTPESEKLYVRDYGPWAPLLESELTPFTEKVDYRHYEQLHPDLPDKENAKNQRADIILVRDLLYREDNLSAALADLSFQLQPGGILILEERHPDWNTALIEGLDEHWWKESSADNPLPARMWPREWQDILESGNFKDIIIQFEPASQNLPQGSFLIFARKPFESSPEKPEQKSRHWVLVPEKATEQAALQLASILQAAGQNAEIYNKNTNINSGNLVLMPGSDRLRLTELLENTVSLACNAPQNSAIRLLTRGGSLLSGLPENYKSIPEMAALTGLARVFNNEAGNRQILVIDVDASESDEDALRIFANELIYSKTPPEEVSWINKKRLLTRIAPVAQIQNKNAERFRLDVSEPGKLDNLQWFPLGELEPGDDEIEAKVMATGLNFRDIMYSLGALPEDALENGFAGAAPGLEYAGIVTRIGKNVKNLAVGDRVAGFASSSFASHVRTLASASAKIPPKLSFEEAAAFPTIFVTAWYALNYLGQLKRGETVLIHGGAGGVGLAAIQIAKKAGARIFATAGSPEKRDLLKLLGVDLIADSRSLNFTETILKATDGKGVDIVLNSLAGEAMRRSLALLKPFGRFLELGKRDFVENTSIGLAPFKENISYFSIDVDQLLAGRPELANKIFGEITNFIGQGELMPPPVRVFGADDIINAFRTMQHSRHIGKIVVDMTKIPAIENLQAPTNKLTTSGTWLVSGGLSGFGLETARHLVEKGVKNLVLASRQGRKSSSFESVSREFSEKGVRLLVEACDMADAESVNNLISKIEQEFPPLTGIVHAAAVFDDHLLENMDEESFAKVIKPKLYGALNLHNASLRLPLKHFVLYSSISVALGNPGQANYVAANAGLESLAGKRLAMGLPASCIAWGPIGDSGYLARNSRVRTHLENSLGESVISTADAMKYFDRLAGQNGVHILANVNWNRVASLSPHIPERYAALVKNGNSPKLTDSLAEKLRQLPREEALKQLCARIGAETAKVLGLGENKVPEDRSLSALGLDSLMAMELATGIEEAVGLRLPPMLMQDAPSVSQLAHRIYERMGSDNNDSPQSNEILADLARKHAENLTPDEINDVIQELKAAQK